MQNWHYSSACKIVARVPPGVNVLCARMLFWACVSAPVAHITYQTNSFMGRSCSFAGCFCSCSCLARLCHSCGLWRLWCNMAVSNQLRGQPHRAAVSTMYSIDSCAIAVCRKLSTAHTIRLAYVSYIPYHDVLRCLLAGWTGSNA